MHGVSVVCQLRLYGMRRGRTDLLRGTSLRDRRPMRRGQPMRSLRGYRRDLLCRRFVRRSRHRLRSLAAPLPVVWRRGAGVLRGRALRRISRMLRRCVRGLRRVGTDLLRGSTVRRRSLRTLQLARPMRGLRRNRRGLLRLRTSVRDQSQLRRAALRIADLWRAAFNLLHNGHAMQRQQRALQQREPMHQLRQLWRTLLHRRHLLPDRRALRDGHLSMS